jgi:hypothetical protein
MISKRWLVVALTAWTTARADPLPAGPSTPELPGEQEAAAAFTSTVDFEHRIRWQTELALVVGSAPIDHVQTSTSPAYSLAGGIRLDRLTLLGEYAIGDISYRGPSTTTSAQGAMTTTDATGLLHRLGVVARYSFVRLGADQGIANWHSELWLEGGVGEQIARWDAGGTFTRPDILFGIGMQTARRASARARGGVFAALRVELGRRTDVDYAPATCSAPCTTPSQPAAWSDRSVLLHVGFLFGD